jgi:hypothetical protein
MLGVLSVINRPKPAIPHARQLPGEGGILFQLRFRLGGEGSGLGLRSWQGQPRAGPPQSRFCLSHFRRRRTTSKSIGSKAAVGRSFGNARFVYRIPSSVMAAGANRLTTKTMTGFRFDAATAMCAGRPGRNHRWQIVHGLFRASGIVMIYRCHHAQARRGQVRMPGSLLESTGRSIFSRATKRFQVFECIKQFQAYFMYRLAGPGELLCVLDCEFNTVDRDASLVSHFKFHR